MHSVVRLVCTGYGIGVENLVWDIRRHQNVLSDEWSELTTAIGPVTIRLQIIYLLARFGLDLGLAGDFAWVLVFGFAVALVFGLTLILALAFVFTFVATLVLDFGLVFGTTLPAAISN